MIAGVPTIFFVFIVLCSLVFWYLLFRVVLPKFLSFLSRLTPNWIKKILVGLIKLAPGINKSNVKPNHEVDPLFWKILANKINELGRYENLFEDTLYTYVFEATDEDVIITKYPRFDPLETRFVDSYSLHDFYYYPPSNLEELNPELHSFMLGYNEDSYMMYK